MNKIFLFVLLTFLQIQSQTTDLNKNEIFVTKIDKVTSTLPSPNFNWIDQTGKKLNFKNYTKNKFVLLNFWATWCGPCRKELPDLISLSKEFKNIQFIGISVDRDSEVLKLVKDFAIEQKISYPILIDNGEVANAFGGIRGIPTTFLINQKGEIVEKIIGMRSYEVFKSSLEKLTSK